MTMTTGRYSPLQAVSQLSLSSALFGLRGGLRAQRSEWARLAWSAAGTQIPTSARGLKANAGCAEHGVVNMDVQAYHLNLGGFKAIDGTILPNGGQSDTAYAPLVSDRNPEPRTTKYRCWSLREGLPSRQ